MDRRLRMSPSRKHCAVADRTLPGARHTKTDPVAPSWTSYAKEETGLE